LKLCNIRMPRLHLKLRLYKAFAKHPNIYYFGLQMSNFLYIVVLTNFLLKAYPYLSLETLAGIGLALPLYMLLSRKIDKLLGR